MRVDRGRIGRLPYAAIGQGPPAVVLAGLTPNTGVDGDWTVRGSLAPFEGLARSRRVHLVNRRPGLPRGMSIGEFAAEHAEALAELGEPVDLIGISTGGSIAQQVAAEHPEVVRRLALISTGCRLAPQTRQEQADVAAHVRAGRIRAAARMSVAELVPPRWGQFPAGVLGWLLVPRLVSDAQAWLDLATTIEAEDGFDLATCPPIAAPTIVIGGGRDRFYPRALFEETARLIPDSRLVVRERRGHVTLLNDRGTRTALGEFLRAGVRPGRRR